MSAVAGFVRRDFQVAVSYRLPFVLEALSAAFVVITFSFVARLVPDARVPEGLGYFEYATIGLAFAAFLQTGLSLAAGNVRQEQVQGTLEATLSSGLGTVTIALGLALYPLLVAWGRVLVYAAFAALLGARAPGANWGLAAAVVALSSASFAGLGLVAAAAVLVLRQAASAVAFGVSLLGLAAGVLFPPDLLPGWMRPVAELSPLTHSLRVAREALAGGGWGDAGAGLAVLAGLALFWTAAGVASISVGLGRARRRGSLADY